jgi:hypothetical protein
MTSPTSTPVDFTVENYGSVFLLRPQNGAAMAMLVEAVEADARWFGNVLAVEARFIGGLVSTLREDGWTVR